MEELPQPDLSHLHPPPDHCSQHPEVKCPENCGNNKRKVIFTFDDDQKLSLLLHLAIAAFPPLRDFKENVTFHEDQKVHIRNIEIATFKTYMQLCYYNECRDIPDLPYGCGERETLQLSDFEEKFLSKFPNMHISNIMKCALFCDHIIVARVCSLYLCKHVIAGKIIHKVQQEFGIPINSEPSFEYKQLQDMYSPFIFTPEIEQIGDKDSQGYKGYVNEDLDIENFPGPSIIETSLNVVTPLNMYVT